MRIVTLNSLDDYQEELNRISLAHENKTLVARGSWTPGQLLGHLASWIEYGYTGYPMSKLP